MDLSICIPTYNRCSYLKKNLDIILSQINDLNRNLDIEICVSDNASTDNTEEMILALQRKYSNNIIKYRKNGKNLGADWNYIYAMKMACGQYSILWGDDDYFKKGSLEFILDLIFKNPAVSVFLSNRTCIDASGHFLREQVFVREDIDTLLVDFKYIDSARSYFSLSRDIACLFSFISSVIYKTKIVEEFEFDDSYIGSQYAFLFFWWNHLTNGNKLLYVNKSYINCTVNVPQSFGKGIDRVLVDYRGYLFIAKKIFNSSTLRLDFLNVINQSHKYCELRALIIGNKKRFMAELYPLLLECGWDRDELDEMISCTSYVMIVKEFIKLCFPFLKK